jgi:hypothetical protein
MEGFGRVRRITIALGGDELEAEDNDAEERAELTPRTQRTSFGLNQGDQRKEAADALEKASRASKDKFLQQTPKEKELKNTADRMRGR